MLDDIRELKTALEEQIDYCDNVFIVGHNGPDFDSIGSAIGLASFVDSLGKDAFIIVDDNELKIEPGVKKVIDQAKGKFNIIHRDTFLNLVSDKSLLIVTDVNKQPMISVKDDLDKFWNIIVIDHHQEDETSIPVEDRYISLDASSASEIVSRVLLYSRKPIDQDVANYLLAGISLDTKRFKINTTDKTHEIAEKLIKHGADTDYVNNLFLEEFESFCRISNLIINGTIIKKYSDSLLAPIQVSFTINRNMPDQIYLKEDLAKAADRMMKFNGIDASFALGFVEPGVVHVSARSNKKVDVGNIMEAIGGGGNPQAAGGRIEIDDIFKVEEELMQKIVCGLSDEENIFDEPKIIKLKQIKKI
ncbi:MAG: DHH family phosphoesterase [Bacilli bacterium]|nr:DHH family phosphoesterase [Bacilli bacterium]